MPKFNPFDMDLDGHVDGIDFLGFDQLVRHVDGSSGSRRSGPPDALFDLVTNAVGLGTLVLLLFLCAATLLNLTPTDATATDATGPDLVLSAGLTLGILAAVGGLLAFASSRSNPRSSQGSMGVKEGQAKVDVVAGKGQFDDQPSYDWAKLVHIEPTDSHGRHQHNWASTWEEDLPSWLLSSHDQGPVKGHTSVWQAEGLGYRLGDRVRHRRFGEGVVSDTRGRGQNQRLTVTFEGVGAVRLLGSSPNVEKIAESPSLAAPFGFAETYAGRAQRSRTGLDETYRFLEDQRTMLVGSRPRRRHAGASRSVRMTAPDPPPDEWMRDEFGGPSTASFISHPTADSGDELTLQYEEFNGEFLGL